MVVCEAGGTGGVGWCGLVRRARPHAASHLPRIGYIGCIGYIAPAAHRRLQLDDRLILKRPKLLIATRGALQLPPGGCAAHVLRQPLPRRHALRDERLLPPDGRERSCVEGSTWPEEVVQAVKLESRPRDPVCEHIMLLLDSGHVALAQVHVLLVVAPLATSAAVVSRSIETYRPTARVRRGLAEAADALWSVDAAPIPEAERLLHGGRGLTRLTHLPPLLVRAPHRLDACRRAIHVRTLPLMSVRVGLC